MTSAPDKLKLIGHLEAPHKRAVLAEYFSSEGWKITAREESLILVHPHMQLHLEGDDLILVHGELSSLEHLPTLTKPLTEANANWHLDVFEEDGRLVKKLQN